MTSVIIAHQTIAEEDAIGHDILGMKNALTALGYETYVYGEYYLGKMQSYAEKRAFIEKLLADPRNIIIYHHSIFWEAGETLLSKCKAKIIFKYHNITPPDFFEKYSKVHFDKTKKGIEQTKRLVKTYGGTVWWGDSIYNCSDLKAYGLSDSQTCVVPPFNVLDDMGMLEPDYRVIDSLVGNNCYNILFVGRVAPNKGHMHMIEVVRSYVSNYGNNLHLWIVGGIDQSNLKAYYMELNHTIKKYGIQRNVTFTDKLPICAIKSFYLSCDAFLCMSMHEGFCVPIIEAQYLGLPVLTYGGTALRDTSGLSQIVIDKLDYDLFAAALYTIFANGDVRRFCRNNGFTNITSRFSSDKIKESFISAFYNVVEESN